MAIKRLAMLAAPLLILGACTQTDGGNYSAPEKGDPGFLKGSEARVDELYLNREGPAKGRGYRDIFIVPANLSETRIVQPGGGEVDEGWSMSDVEVGHVQESVRKELTAALEHDHAYNIKTSREDAEILLYTNLVAMHPNATRSEVEAGARPGGSITASFAVIDAESGSVLVRAVDTKSTDNIWSFHNVEGADPAIDLIFRAWGNSLRRGLLTLQGRSTDPLAPAITVKEQ